jgi:zinc D-Ala-D-Ala carboxypeptidase
MAHSEPARAAARRTRSAILAAFLVVSAGLVGVHMFRSLGSSAGSPSSAESPFSAGSPFPAGSPSDTRHRPRAFGEAAGAVPYGVTVFDDEIPAVANLDPDLLGALRDAAPDAAADGVEIFVNSGWRTAAYQEQLFREAVTKYGSEEEAARWVATAETSAHVSGDAIDIGHSDATTWLSQHGAEYGLCQIYDNEPWHYELRPDAIDDGCPARYADPTHDP